MHRDQLVGGVVLLGAFTGHNEEFVLQRTAVATAGVGSPSERAVRHVDRPRAPVAVLLTVLAGDVGRATGGSHVPEGFMQKGVFWLTVLGVIVDTRHCCVALLRTCLDVLNLKPAGLGETLRLSAAEETHGLPQPQQQQEGKAPAKIYRHAFQVVLLGSS